MSGYVDNFCFHLLLCISEPAAWKRRVGGGGGGCGGGGRGCPKSLHMFRGVLCSNVCFTEPFVCLQFGSCFRMLVVNFV